jgi:hypothetical protein
MSGVSGAVNYFEQPQLRGIPYLDGLIHATSYKMFTIRAKIKVIYRVHMRYDLCRLDIAVRGIPHHHAGIP